MPLSPFSYVPVIVHGLPVHGATLAYYRASTTEALDVCADPACIHTLGVELMSDSSGHFPVHYLRPGFAYKAVRTANGLRHVFDHIHGGAMLTEVAAADAAEEAPKPQPPEPQTAAPVAVSAPEEPSVPATPSEPLAPPAPPPPEGGGSDSEAGAISAGIMVAVDQRRAEMADALTGEYAARIAPIDAKRSEANARIVTLTNQPERTDEEVDELNVLHDRVRGYDDLGRKLTDHLIAMQGALLRKSADELALFDPAYGWPA